MLKVPEEYRITDGIFGSSPEDGCNGCFRIPGVGNKYYNVICSDGMGWEHVSVTVFLGNQRVTATWDEMCMIKDLFWDEEDCVVQYHPPKSEYVDNNPNCLHMWRPVGIDFIRPPKILVGV